ncbi:TetR/AcrR family transcriptional regulator [Aeromicrobium sp. Root495]|uniref:TetR/AcrR family transcriptional regulator n=1 Tax=Aeromicrobium sp. Root495 TaxID=1736550 RepID=UPI0009EC85BD|nr:TetR/AcrR family transcriptional regulator [Aeromicrobium sp. Root495]
MDVRRRRSRDRLHRAVLELARTSPVSELTVTQVARAAGVHRSTFYEHADSTTDLLQAALLSELDALRADLLADPSAAAVHQVTRGVLEHVRTHAPIYRRGLASDAGSAALHGMLSEHFLESSRQVLRSGRLRVPLHLEGEPDGVTADAAARFVASGTVGVIQAWLERAGEPDVASFEALYDALVPDWWLVGARAE